MHIPDGFLPLRDAIIYWLIAIVFIARALMWAKQEMNEASVPVFATLSAGVFAIQALNVPIPWGTSGHMVGGVLTAILLGSPWAGVLLLTVVLVIQGLLFADGGLLSMGANILNMGVISTFAGYYIYLYLRKSLGAPISSFIGAWVGIVLAALACAVELGIAGTFPLKQGLMFMGIYHVVIGIVAEGVLTAIVVKVAEANYPEMFPALRGVSG